MFGCNQPPGEKAQSEPVGSPESALGTLFIVGGGARTPQLMADLKAEADPEANNIAILTLASSEPDTSFWYLKKDMISAGFLEPWHFEPHSTDEGNQLELLSAADIIFLGGGDQRRFMKLSDSLGVGKAIEKAYRNGALIAGTSAGAAVMSAEMIPGDQKLEPEYESTYSRVAADNAIYLSGLGLVPNAIIDQHFIVRSRYNRLLTALHDFPKKTGIGIDESTAIVVRGNEAKVVGDGQVVVMRLRGNSSKGSNQRIRLENVNLDIYLRNDTFKISD